MGLGVLDKVGSMKYEIISPNSNKILLSMCDIVDELDYTGEALTPLKGIYDGNYKLVEGKDYKITYNDNVKSVSSSKGGNVGTITGMGSYSGTVSFDFVINSVGYEFGLYIPEEIEYGTLVNPEITYNPKNQDIHIQYSWHDKNGTKHIATNSKSITEVGEYELEASVYGNLGYKDTDIIAKFKIVPAPNELKIQCDNVVEGNKINVKVITNKSNGEITYYYKKQSEGNNSYKTTVPTAVGKYTVKAVSKATDNYKSAEATANFEIISKPKYKLGDVDNNGEITVSDAIMVLQHVAKNKILTGNQLLAADVDKTSGNVTTSESITVSDAIKILQYVAKNINSFD